MKELKEYEYYRTENGVLYCGDCLEILPLLPDNSVDLVLTDPPYGMNKFKGDEKNFTDVLIKPCFDALKQKFKNILFVVFTGTGDLKRVINAIDLHFERCLWMYKPADCTFPFIKWLLKSEAILLFSNGKFKRKKRYKSYCHDVMQQRLIGKEGVEGHPTVKPLSIILEFMDVVNDNDLVLDPFFGSGTTGLACEKLGRKWIGIEISEAYCAIAKKRIEQEARQIKLF